MFLCVFLVVVVHDDHGLGKHLEISLWDGRFRCCFSMMPFLFIYFLQGVFIGPSGFLFINVYTCIFSSSYYLFTVFSCS